MTSSETPCLCRSAIVYSRHRPLEFAQMPPSRVYPTLLVTVLPRLFSKTRLCTSVGSDTNRCSAKCWRDRRDPPDRGRRFLSKESCVVEIAFCVVCVAYMRPVSKGIGSFCRATRSHNDSGSALHQNYPVNSVSCTRFAGARRQFFLVLRSRDQLLATAAPFSSSRRRRRTTPSCWCRTWLVLVPFAFSFSSACRRHLAVLQWQHAHESLRAGVVAAAVVWVAAVFLRC